MNGQKVVEKHREQVKKVERERERETEKERKRFIRERGEQREKKYRSSG